MPGLDLGARFFSMGFTHRWGMSPFQGFVAPSRLPFQGFWDARCGFRKVKIVIWAGNETDIRYRSKFSATSVCILFSSLSITAFLRALNVMSLASAYEIP